MSRYITALLAPFGFAAVNAIDEKLIRITRSSGALVIISGLFGVVIAIILFIVGRILGHQFWIDDISKLLFIGVGVLEVLWFYPYLKALETERISSVVPWFQVGPVFAAFLGFVFLGENLGTWEIITGGMIVLGAALFQWDWKKGSGKGFSRNAFLMVSAALMIAVSTILFKFVAHTEPSFIVSAFWTNIGLFCAGIFFLFIRKYRQEVVQTLQKNPTPVILWSIANETLNAGANLAFFYAVLLVPVGHVYAIGALQPVIIFIYDILFGGVYFKKMGSRLFFFRFCSLGLVVCGSILFARTIF